MASSSSSSVLKRCFNSSCKQELERSRKGWRRRTGDYAELCDRCASAFEEGKFCENFHSNASGWRCCESCGKKIHCGCIVSFHLFVLLDAGGIECITCAKKSFILTPNPAWPPPSLVLPGLPDRIKDLSLKNWSSIAASGRVPWRQAPSLFNSELYPKINSEVDRYCGIDQLLAGERLSASSLDKQKNEDPSEILMNGSLKSGALQIFENGTSGSKCKGQPSPHPDVIQQAAILKNDRSTKINLLLNSSSKVERTEKTKVLGSHAQHRTLFAASANLVSISNGAESSGEAQTRNGRPLAEAGSKNMLLSRFWPKITNQELQQISGDSNSVITPLFEKTLSASDAGRIGRLILPKKSAEAYLPPISNSDGIPLKVQDLKGKEWVFQFRFWPNNNSRMYVLEGITPCIQSMQLQAGDTVTFSRLEPHGKLVMGCRKASASPSDQIEVPLNTGNGASSHGDTNMKAGKRREVVSTRDLNGNSASCRSLEMNKTNLADSSIKQSKVDTPKYINILGAKLEIHNKRKNSNLGSRSKRLRIENEDMIELKLTWGQAQGLFRPPNDVHNVVIIEGHEVEEFEESPIIGRPTILATDCVGEKIQWAQCEDCFKWRKVPGDVLLPSRWTCSGNLWDTERSVCSAVQELKPEELEDLLATDHQDGVKNVKAVEEDPNLLDTSEGLDTLADLAIQEDGDALPSSSQATRKHPRHRVGCTCIVCIQPPSGKGPKHKQTCTCNVCLTVKRRFRNLMLRLVEKQSLEKAETSSQKPQQPEELADEEFQLRSYGRDNSPNTKEMDTEGPEGDPNTWGSSALPFKGQFDLNIQPELEEELSPHGDSGSMMRFSLDANERNVKQKNISNSAEDSARNNAHHSKIEVENNSNEISLVSSHQNADSLQQHS